MDDEAVEANYIAGTPYVGANVRFYAGPGRQSGRVHGWDPSRQRRCGLQRQVSRLERNARRPPATWFSSAPWTAGSRRSMRAAGKSFGNSRLARESSASPSPIADPTASSTSPFFPESGAGRGDRLRRSRFARRHRGDGGATHCSDLKNVTQPGGTLYVFSLP